MLSNSHHRSMVTFYSVGLISWFMVGCMILLFFHHYIMRPNYLLEQQRAALLAQLNHVDIPERATQADPALCHAHDVLKQKIIAWIDQSKAQLIDIRFETEIMVSVVGSFSEDLEFLITLANAHVMFDLRAIDMLTVKQGIELRVIIAPDKTCAV